MIERHFGRSLGSLEALFDFVAAFLSSQDLDPAHAFEIDLVVEELFTNMIKYNRGTGHDIAVALERTGPALTVRLRDFDVEPFDVTRAPAVDVTRPLEERSAGGLGLHLVRQVADSIGYDYRDRVSTITVVKRLES